MIITNPNTVTNVYFVFVQYIIVYKYYNAQRTIDKEYPVHEISKVGPFETFKFSYSKCIKNNS